MKIHTLDKANPDAYFPVVHTCFFSIELPKYTSRDVCYKQLLWAINNCQSIDADNTRESKAECGGERVQHVQRDLIVTERVRCRFVVCEVRER